jgi:GT2 family glycosyltransferase
MKIYNLIVTYNRAPMLEKVLCTLSGSGYKNIIVINNASTDHTNQVLENNLSSFEVAEVVTSDVNLGGAGGFALAMRRFVEISSDDAVAVLHDDDSWPSFNLESLEQSLSGKSDILGCFPVLHPDGILNAMNIPGVARFIENPLSYLSMRLSGKVRRPRVLDEFKNFQSFDYCSFVGFVISRNLIVNHGVVSDKFFIYSDDTTYTYLLSKRAGRIGLIGSGNLTFTHDCKRSTGKTLLEGNFANYSVRNKVIFFRLCSHYSYLFIVIFITQSLIAAPKQARLIFKSALEGLRVNKADYGLVDV